MHQNNIQKNVNVQLNNHREKDMLYSMNCLTLPATSILIHLFFTPTKGSNSKYQLKKFSVVANFQLIKPNYLSCPTSAVPQILHKLTLFIQKYLHSTFYNSIFNHQGKTR